MWEREMWRRWVKVKDEWEMWRRWVRDVKEMSERCEGDEWEMWRRWVRDVKEMSERCEGDEWEMWRRWVRDVKEMSERCEGDEWEMWRRWVRDVKEMSERCEGDEWEMWVRRWVREMVRDEWEMCERYVRDPFYHSEHTVASTHFTAMWLQNNIQVLFCYFLGFNHSIRIVNTLLLVLISLHCSCRTAFKCHIFCWLIVHVCDLSFQWEVGFVSLQKSLLKVTSLLYTDDTANASINMSNQGQTSNCSCRISTDTC